MYQKMSDNGRVVSEVYSQMRIVKRVKPNRT